MTQGEGHGKLHVDIKTGEHRLISGLSTELGGLNEGPDPHRLLEASLTACTILTLQLYANRKQWDLASIDVTVNIDAETSQGTHIVRKIRFASHVTADQIERLAEIANKCPIHKLLTAAVAIETKVI